MSRFAGPGYAVGRPTRQCAATGVVLNVGDRYVATLIEGADGHWLRQDFSVAAWAAGARPKVGEAEGVVIGSWRAVVHASQSGAKHQRLALDDESMLDLLGQVEPGEPKRDALRLVLALMLVQRRALVQEGSKAGAMVLRPRGTPAGTGLIEVKDRGVDEALVAEALGELEALAGGEAPGAGSTAQPPATETAEGTGG